MNNVQQINVSLNSNKHIEHMQNKLFKNKTKKKNPYLSTYSIPELVNILCNISHVCLPIRILPTSGYTIKRNVLGHESRIVNHHTKLFTTIVHLEK